MKDSFESIILTTAIRYITPFVLVYGVYVLFHGEFSPGGGFQAGGFLGIAVVLDRLVNAQKAVLFVPDKTAVILAGIGTFIYVFVGITAMMFAGNFLDYGALPFASTAAERHLQGISGVEIGVALCVMSTIIIIFDALARGKE